VKAVLDTNIIVSRAIAPHGASATIVARWLEGAFELLVSPDILDEYRQTLARPGIQRRICMSAYAVSIAIADIARVATSVVPEQRVSGVSADPDDDVFLECALAGSAVYIVTGDQHLLSLGTFRGIAIVPPVVFVLILDDLNQP